jgi:zinc/manganese transport system substrate-binding protein
MILARLAALLLGTLLLSGPRPAAARLKVAATVPDLAALAQAVGGDRVEVFSLTLPTQDPHFVDARPHLALQLNKANLLLLVGLELEAGWLPTLITGARNPAIQVGAEGYLDCSGLVALKEVPRTKVDRSMGDIHPGGNPHYLTDPDNALRVAAALVDRLARLDPAGRAAYAENARRFGEALGKARARWTELARPFRGAEVVTYHKSWIYVTDSMGLGIAATLEPKPGIPPSPAHVLSVIQIMRQRKVRVLLQEEYYPDRTAKLVAEKTGARLLILEGGTRVAQGESYVQRMDKLMQKLAAALGGR